MQDDELVSPPADDQPAAEMPDPAGPPQPVKREDPVLGLISGLGVVAVAIGGLMVPMCATMGHTAGATRSAKVQWEQRREQVEQAVRDDRAQASPRAKAEEGTRERSDTQ